MKQVIVKSDTAPLPIGPYSQAIRFDKLLFLSGQIALDAQSGALVSGGVEAQTRQVLNNLSSVLHAGGASIETVLKTTIFLKDITDFGKVNEIYTEFFKTSLPARSTVEVSRLPKDVLVEIDCIAYTD
jgi:2-iminobutanoate/2-iminopropanoate deaminase